MRLYLLSFRQCTPFLLQSLRGGNSPFRLSFLAEPSIPLPVHLSCIPLSLKRDEAAAQTRCLAVESYCVSVLWIAAELRRGSEPWIQLAAIKQSALLPWNAAPLHLQAFLKTFPVLRRSEYWISIQVIKYPFGPICCCILNVCIS